MQKEQKDLFDWFPDPITVTEAQKKHLMATPANYRSADTTNDWKKYCHRAYEATDKGLFDSPVSVPDIAEALEVDETNRFLEVTLTMLQQKKHLEYDDKENVMRLGTKPSTIASSFDWYSEYAYHEVLERCFKSNGFAACDTDKKTARIASAMDSFLEQGDFYDTQNVFTSANIVDAVTNTGDNRSVNNTFITRFLARLYAFYAVKRWTGKIGARGTIYCYQVVDPVRAREMMSNIGHYDHTRSPMLTRHERELEYLEYIGDIRKQQERMIKLFEAIVSGIGAIRSETAGINVQEDCGHHTRISKI